MEGLSFAELLEPLIKTAALILGGLLVRRLNTPTSKVRAEHLALIAGSAAALVRANNPNASWSKLLDDTVREIANAAGLPTSNNKAITRAAAAALTQLGASPAK